MLFFCLYIIHATCQFPHTGVRKGAVMAVGQFCKGFHNLLLETGTEDKTARKENPTAVIVQLQPASSRSLASIFFLKREIKI